MLKPAKIFLKATHLKDNKWYQKARCDFPTNVFHSKNASCHKSADALQKIITKRRYQDVVTCDSLLSTSMLQVVSRIVASWLSTLYAIDMLFQLGELEQLRTRLCRIILIMHCFVFIVNRACLKFRYQMYGRTSSLIVKIKRESGKPKTIWRNGEYKGEHTRWVKAKVTLKSSTKFQVGPQSISTRWLLLQYHLDRSIA